MTTNKYMSNAGDFDCHADTAVRYGAHRSVEHIPGFTRGSHWMPPLDECSHFIAAAATMVDDFWPKTQNNNKNYF
jgi:hypothetical protein